MSKKTPAKRPRAPKKTAAATPAPPKPPTPRKFQVHGSFGANGYLVHGTMSGGNEPAVDVEIEGGDVGPRDGEGEGLATAYARVSIGAGTAEPLRVSVELDGKISPLFEFLGKHGPGILAGYLPGTATLPGGAPSIPGPQEPAPSDLRAFLASLHPAQFELLMGALTDAQKELLAARGVIDASTTPMPRAPTQSSRAPVPPAPGSDASAKG